MFAEGQPIVFLEDARPGGGGRLFASPSETIVALELADVVPAMEKVRDGLKRGLHAAGWLSYEAGFAFEERLMSGARPTQGKRDPLLWFGLFDRFIATTQEALVQALPDQAGAWLSAPRPRLTYAAYEAAFLRAKDYIHAGDAYQMNLSYRADLTLLGHPLAAYARLRAAGQGGWSAVVHDGNSWLLSTSPELFFRVASGAIEARPMKGTAKRHADPAEDRLAALRLREDPKERAENVMIVDLLRNDLSRIAQPGSVHVPELFAIETYPTLHTLTSTVRAQMREDCDVIDIVRALFPCGSVTGAPKIRAMEIIGELEGDARGPYTGSIGWLSPEGSAEFNVAIRTLAVRGEHAEIGLGSAVVADSLAEGEWAECSLKGAFLTAAQQSFELIETMRCDPKTGIALLDLHVARLSNSARVLDFSWDESVIRERLRRVIDAVTLPCVVRVSLAQTGELSIEQRDAPASPTQAVDVTLRPSPVRADDFRLRHKTSSRAFYDAARLEADVYEVVFVDAAGFVTEGSVTNVFVERDGVLLTPPLRRGLLPGVLRASLLASGSAREADISPADLHGGFFVGNAVRGLVSARLLEPL